MKTWRPPVWSIGLIGLASLIGVGLLLDRPVLFAQIFSPGKLSQFHNQWDSLKQCGICHSPDHNLIDDEDCLNCHKPLQQRIQQQQGYHGRSPDRQKNCGPCHVEHKGAAAQLINWPGGQKSKWNHAETGWELRGAHAKIDCEKCHDRRLIRDKAVIAYIGQYQPKQTFLGLTPACSDCHFDEHRGELGKNCSTCHDEIDFKKAPKFQHDSSWRLVGAHQRLKCEKCHKPLSDSAGPNSVGLQPKSKTYLHLKPLKHEQCTDCHSDVHRNRFGPDCLKCHNQASWQIQLTGPEEAKIQFHDKTNFPLKGRHRLVPCIRCHGQGKGGALQQIKPIAHDQCGRCHPSAHPDIPAPVMASYDCRSCHSEAGYKPANFDSEAHQQTRFPLRGAHLAVACPECHLTALGLPLVVGDAKALPGQFRSSLVLSPWRMRQSELDLNSCRSCHRDPHAGQFGERKCQECHDGTTWRLPSFDHNNKTNYQLTGKHQNIACQACHKATGAGTTVVRYRGLETRCDACHGDIHYGQFSQLTPTLTCERCHTFSGFNQLRFDHNDPAYSDWPLRERHQNLKCEKCHPEVSLGDTLRTRRYRPTPKICQACHADYHRGALAEPAKPGQKNSAAMVRTGEAPPWQPGTNWIAHLTQSSTDCQRCHSEKGFQFASFNHAATAFPLKGQHKRADCNDCHKAGTTPAKLSRACRDCHRDIHRGKLGSDCQTCHDEERFAPAEKARARHNRTNFPLIGRHAMIACTECHQDVRDMEFHKTPTACAACHQDDAPVGQARMIDHSQFKQRCDSCHSPLGWDLVNFGRHNQCFPITSGNHAGVACAKCHVKGIPAAVNHCNSNTFSCVTCHGCETGRHREVRNYQCQDADCYHCHRGGGED